MLRCKASPWLLPCLRFGALPENKILLEFLNISYVTIYWYVYRQVSLLFLKTQDDDAIVGLEGVPSTFVEFSQPCLKNDDYD